MLRALLIAVASLGLATAQVQSTVLITFTSDPEGAILSIGLPGEELKARGPTPITVPLVPGEVYSLRLVAPEPFTAYDLYVPYSGTYLTPTDDTEVSVWIERTTAAQQEAQRSPPAAPQPLFSTPINSTTPSNRTCCRICSAGKPCGDSCIGRNKTCRQPPGCAC